MRLGRLASAAFLLAFGAVGGFVLAVPRSRSPVPPRAVAAPVLLSWEEVGAAIRRAVGREVRDAPDAWDLRLEISNQLVDWYLWDRTRTVVVSGWEFGVYGVDAGEKAPSGSVDVMEHTYGQSGSGRGRWRSRVVRLYARPHPE